VNRNGDVLEGGLTSTADRNAFGNRSVSHLELRWYKPKGSLLKKAGYTIVATSGEKYIPAAQH
jgi:hypothetical protein